MAENLRYVTPFSPFDPPSSDLLVLFLEAVARVTSAFTELRESILPKFNPPYAPVEEISAWIDRHHLGLGNYQLREMVESWTYDVLRQWREDDGARNQLRVDQGWWERLSRKNAGDAQDKPPVTAAISQWNPAREPFEQYAARTRARIEDLITKQKKAGEGELRAFSMRQYRVRHEQYPPQWRFEWLALSICAGRSAGYIAHNEKRARVSRDVVKKAIQRLKIDLHIDTGDRSD